MKVRTRTTFFLGDLNPTTSLLRVRYFSTSFMKASAFSHSPLKRGGSFPIAFTLATAATGWAAAAAAWAGPPPPGGPGGFPPVPPPCSPMATLRSSSNSYSVRGCCAVTTGAAVACVAVWVVVCVVVILVPVILCEKSLFVMVKNGVCVIGIVGARGSFSIAGLWWMATSRVSGSGSDSLLCVCMGTLTS